jgi:hypothetical protein
MRGFGNWSNNVDTEIHFLILSINSSNNQNHIEDSSEEISTFEAMDNNVVDSASQVLKQNADQHNQMLKQNADQHNQMLKQNADQHNQMMKQFTDMLKLNADQHDQMVKKNADQHDQMLKQIAVMVKQNADQAMVFRDFIEKFEQSNNVSSRKSLPLSAKRHRADDSVAVAPIPDIAAITTTRTVITNEAKLSLFNQQVASHLGIQFKYVSIDVSPIFSVQQQVMHLDVFKNKLRDPMHEEKFFPKESRYKGNNE